MWPDLSMLSYQKAAPLLRAICAKHGVPVRSSRHFGTAVSEMLEYMFANNAPERRAQLAQRDGGGE